ncbi:MAG: hypothetical protein AAFX06_16290 [Planctomycetota bacterium]
MANPYQSPPKSTLPSSVGPTWYVLLSQFYWPAWWIGTAMIAASWFNLVSTTIGWIGFGITGAATVASYLLPTIAGAQANDYVMLDSRLLASKGEACFDAMRRFSNGARLMYDGVAFRIRPDRLIDCDIVAQSPNINQHEAGRIADHAESVFEALKQSSPEFASAVAGHTLRISILSSLDANATKLFHVVDGVIERA